MSKANGFLQLRRGIWEHLRDGRMTVTQGLAFIYICSEADTRTGIWKGSAKSLSGELGIPERTARDVLEKMEHGDYIRRFAVPGRHACYPILVHKFLITDGQHHGEQLNAIESKSFTDLAYFSRQQSVEDGVQRGVEQSAAQKRKRIEKEKEKNPAAKTVSPADLRFEEIQKHYFHETKRKCGTAQWDGVDGKALNRLLKAEYERPAGWFTGILDNAFRSTDTYPLRPGFRFTEFGKHFQKYTNGPLLRGKPLVIPRSKPPVSQEAADAECERVGIVISARSR